MAPPITMRSLNLLLHRVGGSLFPSLLAASRLAGSLFVCARVCVLWLRASSWPVQPAPILSSKRAIASFETASRLINRRLSRGELSASFNPSLAERIGQFRTQA